MRKIEDVVIIGGGVAGSTVAIYLARAGYKPKLLSNDIIGGNLNAIEEIQNFVGIYNAKGTEVAEDLVEQLEQSGLEADVDYFETVHVTSVELISEDNKTDIYEIKYKDFLDDEHIILSHNVVVATGQKNLLLPQLDKSVEQHTCVLCDGFMFKDKTVVVIGGGNSALTEAIELSKIVKKVYLVTRRPEFRAEKILQEKVAQTENILHSVGNLKSVIGNTYTFDTHTLNADGLFVYIGSVPNVDFMPTTTDFTESGHIDSYRSQISVGLKESRHAQMKDSFFAVGDVNGEIEAKQFGIAIGQATDVATRLIKKLSK